MKKQSGFTLIELMVVMAIIAILATAGLSAFTNYLQGARDTKRIAIAREMQTIVEALTTVSGPPSPAEINAYLEAEGLAWNIPAENPLLVRAAESLVGAVGVLGVPDTLALIEDPIGGKPVCLNHLNEAVMVCQFVYYKFSDGTYAISYGVEKEGNLINAHYSSLSSPRTYGVFIGTNAAITVTPTPETTDIEAESVNSGVDGDGLRLSVTNDTNGGGSGGAVGATCAVNGDCISGQCHPGWLTCTSGENEAPCNDDTGCNSGFTCGMGGWCTNGQIGSICPANQICEAGLLCDGDRCFAPRANGESCTVNEGCVSGICFWDNMCGIPDNTSGGCTSNDECRDGLTCFNGGLCSTGSQGAYCDFDDQCNSGICADPSGPGGCG